eukprot:2156384-Karenia_brevis.AAC.1
MDKQDTKKWLKTLPKVQVKETYLAMEAPKAKSEGVGRASWPKDKNKDFAELPRFRHYLAQHLLKNDGRVETIVL